MKVLILILSCKSDSDLYTINNGISKTWNSIILDDAPTFHYFGGANHCNHDCSSINTTCNEQYNYMGVRTIETFEYALNNFEFEKELKKCDIMPLLHSSNRAKTFGSGFLYSCMGSEIIMIIPKNISNWKKLIPVRSYLEAKNINEYVAKTELIIKKLNHYKKLVKKTKVEYLKNLKKNKLIKRIVECKYN